MNKQNRGGAIAAPKKIISLILAAVMLLLVAGVIGYFVSEPSVGGTVTELPPVMDGDGNELDGEKVYELPKAMVFTKSAAAQNSASVTLQATVLPDNAANKTVDWSVTFKNPSVAWAKNKVATDYITVTPSGDGSTRATVTCLENFGAQILITVTSRDNTEAKATCTVDYARKLLGYKFGFINSGISSDVNEWFMPTQYSDDKEVLEQSVKVSLYQPSNFDGGIINEYSEVYTKTYTEENEALYFEIRPTDGLKSALDAKIGSGFSAERLRVITSEDNISCLFDSQFWNSVHQNNATIRNNIRETLLSNNGIAYEIVLMTRPEQAGGKVLAVFNVRFDTTLLSEERSVDSVTLGDSTLEF